METLLREMGEAGTRYARCPGRAPGTDIRISAKEKHPVPMIPVVAPAAKGPSSRV